MAVLNSEFIIPTPFINDKYADSLRTSLFVDAGTVWSTSWQNSAQTQAAGILTTAIRCIFVCRQGLRCSGCRRWGRWSFLGPNHLKKYDGDKAEQFQFNIGKTGKLFINNAMG